MQLNAILPINHATTAASTGTGTGTGAAGTTGAGATGTGTATGTTGTSGTSSAASTSASGGVSLGGTDFLTLMLAQLQNQDPTSPVDSNVFLTQLAELSEVQGITQLNTSFTTLSNSLVQNQTMQASSLLGNTALVPSSTATLATAGATVTGAVAVPQTTSQVQVDIADSTGNVVQQINLGAQQAGIANFSWNGTESNGAQAPAGQYTISAQVNGVAAGTNISTYVNGVIQSVTMGSGSTGMYVNVSGQGPVLLSNVAQISSSN
jgi:flagellar basal-body rod modification protein FlgD